MKRLTILLVLLIAASAANAQADHQPATRFAVADVYIETQSPLAAYQVDVTAEGNGVKLVGIEGGEHPAFVEPPYYDPSALQRQRVILAAFSTSADLPTTRTRVARLHLQVEPDANLQLQAKSIVIANPEGQPIAAKVAVVEGVLP